MIEHGEKNICAYNLATAQERCLDLPGDQGNPHISGDFVSFEDSVSGAPHISLWHLPSGAVLPINLPDAIGDTGQPSAQFLNAIDGHRVVYTDDREGQLDIYMYEFTVTYSQDTTPPVFGPLPAPVVEATNGPQAVVTYSVSATDDTDTNPVVVCAPASGSVFSLGTTAVQCTATDASGNVAHATFSVRVVDTHPPTLNLPSNVVADAISPSGAPVTFIVSAVDAVDAHPTISCTPPSGSMIAIGTTTVTCTATDGSGNASSGSFTVLVKAAAAQIMDLVALVNSFNLKQGIQNSLDSKLQNADAALTAANAGNRANVCNLLVAFIDQTNAQAGGALTVDQASQLVTDASRIGNVLGCQ